MAIKGKRKGKARTARVVTPGPRPAYVPPRVPPLRRPGGRFLVALIIEGILFALLVGFAEESQTERQRDAVGEFTALIEAELSSQGEAIQALPSSALVLPQLQTRLTELTSEQPPEADAVVEEAEGWAESMRSVATGVTALEVPGEELEPQQSVALTDAKSLIERGLVIYAGLADQVAVAATLEGAAQSDLVATIQEQQQVAASVFNAGYGKLQQVRQELELPTVADVPGGGFPPEPGLQPPIDTSEIPAEIDPGELPVEIEPGGGGGGGQGGGGNG